MYEQIGSEKLADPPSTYSIENTLAEQLLKLSFEDRDHLNQEIHGVHCKAIVESVDLNRWKLEEFDRQINYRKNVDPTLRVLRNIVHTYGPNRVGSNNCYVNDDLVRIRFLRCELFDVGKAVQRFIYFLEFMSELFGDFVADRSVQLSDFSHAEQAIISTSRNQILPFRDRSGRALFVGVGNCNYHIELKLRVKIYFYLCWSVSEDEETQIKGLVVIGWFFDEANNFTWEKNIWPAIDAKAVRYNVEQNRSLPVRVACRHHCYADKLFFRILAKRYMFYSNKSFLSNYKVHFGSDIELRYTLRSYGVPEELIPISSTRKLKFDNHRSFLNMRRAKMNHVPNDPNYREIVQIPRSNDVIFRKGPSSKYNKGNEFYRKMLQEHCLEHFTGNKSSKYEITLSVISAIESRKGRFLEWKDDAWLVITSSEYARRKVAAGFKQYNRNFGRKEARQLLETIHNVIDISENGSEDNPNDPTNKSSIAERNRYAFIDNPTKRHKTSHQKTEDNHECFCALSST